MYRVLLILLGGLLHAVCLGLTLVLGALFSHLLLLLLLSNLSCLRVTRVNATAYRRVYIAASYVHTLCRYCRVVGVLIQSLIRFPFESR